jgi:hypothetical protein
MFMALCVTSAAAATAAPATKPPSVAETKSIVFHGESFELEFHPLKSAVALYEYYPAGSTPEQWMELIDFRIYPENPSGNTPADFAQRLANDYKKRYPGMNLGLYEEKATHAVLLDFFYPMSTRHEAGKTFLEFDAFKFFSDPVTGKTLSCHYARNIEGPGEARQTLDVVSDIKTARAEIIPALAALPPYTE